MKAHNNNQLYKSPADDQLWNSGRQYWIFSHIGDQEGTISDPGVLFGIASSRLCEASLKKGVPKLNLSPGIPFRKKKAKQE